MMEDQPLRSLFQKKRPTFTIGSVGPYNIQVDSLITLMGDNQVSDEVMDSICDLLSKDRPGVVHINCHTLTKILDGSKRAKSHYFLKNNILEKAKEVFGVYLERGNHWSFFHCKLDGRCLTYFNSLGETELQCQAISKHWSAFADSRGLKGEWHLKTTTHSLQTDSVSCGIHTLAFATEFMEAGGLITSFQCPEIQQERMRLASLLFQSLDRTKKMWNMCKKVLRKNENRMCLWGCAARGVCSHTHVLHMSR
ncbi:uncharacterized protein isoform X1 [Danio rerio]|uniref:Uncharacterized protein isoform X1 n=3 Tax=Danio rerio TaxID=7955 RepID=A0AC58IH56_DANRE